jgi:lysozyme
MSKEGIEMLKRFEGCSLSAYQDAGGFSIGYGHHGAKEGQTITQEQAESLLKSDLDYFEKGVENSLMRDVSQKQFDALVSYAYNCGLPALQESNLFDCVNSEDDDKAVEEWTRGWEDTPHFNRRKEESELYASGTTGDLSHA